MIEKLPNLHTVCFVPTHVVNDFFFQIGDLIGYQIRLESATSKNTLLTFCTNGVLLRTLMGDSEVLKSVTHVIVDEVHERDKFSDYLLAVLRDALKNFPHLKVILMSATMDAELFL